MSAEKPSLAEKLRLLVDSPLPDAQRLQVLIHLTAELAASVEGACPRCIGTGNYNSKECAVCEGTGRI